MHFVIHKEASSSNTIPHKFFSMLLWTPSQFYRDLKKLVASLISNDIVLMFCNNCLPVNMQRVLAAIREMSADALTMVLTGSTK